MLGESEIIPAKSNLRIVFRKGVGRFALAKANARVENLITDTPAIIYSSVPTGDFKMTFVRDGAQRVLGYKPKEMVADPNSRFNHIPADDALSRNA